MACIAARYVLALLTFLGLANLHMVRVELSVAIVAMVEPTHKAPREVNDEGTCPRINGSMSSPVTSIHNREFTWDSKIQGIILGSFFFGYLPTQIPGAWLGQRFGAKRVYGVGVFFSGVLSLLAPVMARVHYGLLIANRVLTGLFQGACYPNTHALLGKWCPPAERSCISSIVYSGSQVGIVSAQLLAGVIAEYLGWEWIFYVFGIISIGWCILWAFCAFDSPADHPRISQAEKDFIQNSLSESGTGNLKVPWKDILTSLPVWVIAIATFGYNWGHWCIFTTVPTYLSNVLHFNLSSNGFGSSIFYIAMGIVMPISGLLADWIRRRRWLSTTNVRKVFHCVGVGVTAASLVGVGHAGCDVTAVMILLTLGGAFAGLPPSSGFQTNLIDISPSFAGMTLGITNMFGVIPGIIAPYIVGLIVSNQTVQQWQVVFYIAAGFYISTGLLYAIFASGELAEWDKAKAQPSQDTQDTETVDCFP